MSMMFTTGPPKNIFAFSCLSAAQAFFQEAIPQYGKIHRLRRRSEISGEAWVCPFPTLHAAIMTLVVLCCCNHRAASPQADIAQVAWHTVLVNHMRLFNVFRSRALRTTAL